MKKFLALLLSLVMVLSLAACGGDSGSTTPPAEDEGQEEPADTGADIKIGLICVHDINSGYDAAHIEGLKAACEALGIDPEDQNSVVMKYNIPEDETCKDTAVDLAEQGCNIIFSDSYGHQSYMLDAASEYPEVTFVACTGDQAGVAGLDNFKNIFPYTYESRYVSGIVAGMKLKELMDAGTVTDPYIGYVGAFPYAEVVSGYTAFFLGIQSIVPEAHMDVQYTNSWYDPVAEGEVANALVAKGCVIIGQHADSTGAPQACQDALKSGTTVYSIGYNIDMLATAPDAALTSATNNWGVYYTYAIAQAMRGQKVATNWVGGFDIGAVAVTQLGSACAAGTAEKVAEVEKAIHDGTLQVFDTSKFTISTKCTDGSYRTDDNGKVLVACATDTDSNFANDTDNAIIDGAYQESYTQSAPSFVLRIDGIKELNANS